MPEVRRAAGALLILATMASGALASEEPVAIVSFLGGAATRHAKGSPPGPVRLFDRLLEGTELRAGSQGKVIVAFLDGSRHEMSGGSRARVTARGLQALAGDLKPLPPWPAELVVAALGSGEPSTSAAVVRLRDRAIRLLYPRDGHVTRAGDTVLRFAPATGARSYGVEVRDGKGRQVFQQEAAGPTVAVPASVLGPGESYIWVVRTIEGPAARGQAAFETLSTEREAARQSLAGAAGRAADPAAHALLAEVDRRWGLLREAGEGYRMALAIPGPSQGLREALEEVSREINPPE
jgi:hypothetical protein